MSTFSTPPSIPHVLDTQKLVKEFSAMSIASEIRFSVFSGKAEEDSLEWIMWFDTVAQALEWDSARKMTQMPLFFGGFASI